MATLFADVEDVADEGSGHEGVEVGFVHGHLSMESPVWVVPVGLDQLVRVLLASAVAELVPSLIIIICKGLKDFKRNVVGRHKYQEIDVVKLRN